MRSIATAPRIFYSIVVVTVLLLSGCGTSAVYLSVTRPAEINLKDYRKIAIGDIVDQRGNKGHHAADVADKITERLFASGTFEVLDRQNLGAILQEHALSESGLIDESSAPEIGKFIGTAALVFGRIQTDSYAEEVTKQEPYTDKDGKTHEYHVRKGTYTLSVSLKVIDIETAKILAVKTLRATKGTSTRADKKDPKRIDSERLYAACVREITGDFIRMVAPYQERVRAAFLTDKLLPETDQAVAYFRIGEWDDGIVILERLTRKTGLASDIQAKTYYNLGLALIFTGKYDLAVEHLKTGLSLDPTSRRIQRAVIRAKDEKMNAARLKEQTNEG